MLSYKCFIHCIFLDAFLLIYLYIDDGVKKEYFNRNNMGINIWLLKGSKIGPYVYVSGTTATDKLGNVVGIDNPYMQSIQIIKNIQAALQRVDAHLTDIIRTRIYTINIGNWKKLDKLI
jgi:Endoribonuclease L-PSP